MLWQLIRGTGCSYSPSYNEDVCADLEIGPLDPVDPELCGKADLKGMKSAMKGITFAMRALMIITCYTVFLSEVNPPEFIRRVPTSSRWWTEPTNHMPQLIGFGLIRPIAEALVKAVSTYFAVGKACSLNFQWKSI